MPMASIPEAFASAVQHHQAGQLQAAEQLYRQILAVDPNHAEALHLLGLIALQQRNYEFAVQVISRAVTLNPAEARFHSSLAAVFQAQGRMDEAIDCFRRTLELNPNLATVHNELVIA